MNSKTSKCPECKSIVKVRSGKLVNHDYGTLRCVGSKLPVQS